MILALLIISFICTMEMFICIYALNRNVWVYKQRIKLLHEDIELYDKLPSYKEMVEGHGFWRWDIKYYLPKEGR